MRMLRTFLPLLALPLLAAAPVPVAHAPAVALLTYETSPPAATHPSLYSFADAYRLAVSGDPLAELGAAPRALRDGPRFAATDARPRLVSSAGVDAAPELRFSVSVPRDGGRWPLLLAGLFACAWVAHRRLTSPY